MPDKASDEEITQQVIAAIEERTGKKPHPCVICGHEKWFIPRYYTTLFLTRNPAKPSIVGPTNPLVPLICQNCGNTHLLNLKVLGFEDTSALELSDEALRGKD